MKIGVFGATGPAGRAVAVQYAAVGHQVIVGSRALERAEETVKELKEAWPSRDLNLVAGDNEAASKAEVVVVATPWEGALATVKEHAEALSGKLVISMANAVAKWGKSMVPLLPPTGSVTSAIALALPNSRVAGAFHHLPAGPWSDLDHPLDCDVLVVAEKRATAREVVALVDELPGLKGVDAGVTANAAPIEALTATLIGINIRYKTHTAIKLAGLP